MTTEIVLTNGYVALVDDEDADRINEHHWWAHRVAGGRVYAERKDWAAQKTIRMHREIMGLPPSRSPQVDHINGLFAEGSEKVLDNRRANLRLATNGQNRANSRVSTTRAGRPAGSRFKGVQWRPRIRRWVASCRSQGTLHYLGCFVVEEDAARAYDEAALRLHGEFARVNFT